VDGHHEHESLPFSGERFSLIAFSHDSEDALPLLDKQRLRAYGFPCQSLVTFVQQPDPDVPFDRFIIEFCCGENSMLGQPYEESTGCKVFRLTEKIDMTSTDGLCFAKQCLHSTRGKPTLLWGSLPCTGGCRFWNQMRHWGPSYRRKQERHIKIFSALFDTFKILAHDVRKAGGYIAYEWPVACAYCTRPDVQTFLQAFQLPYTVLHGCMVGVKSIAPSSLGVPIKKPW
jgi:hypothetical protein